MEIFKTIKTIGGLKVDFIICRGFHISRANGQYMKNADNDNLDFIPFLMVEICLVDGEKKDVDYYLNMLGDDYIYIVDVMNELLQKIN